MTLTFPHTPPLAPLPLMRTLGYAPYMNRQGVQSFVRRLRGTEFPRLHAYLETTASGFRLSVHLDQKAACYRGTSAHSGEYDGKIVEDEAVYMKKIIAGLEAKRNALR